MQHGLKTWLAAGALCVAAVVDRAAARDLFRKLMIWGLSMAIVGAVLSGLLAAFSSQRAAASSENVVSFRPRKTAE